MPDPFEKKWQTVSAFMLIFASKQFYVTLAVILFEAFVVWVGTHLPDKITMSEYIALIGIVHGFLIVVVTFWFNGDNKKRETENKTSQEVKP
jgi:amino acid permease